jgi:hypothetical protein
VVVRYTAKLYWNAAHVALFQPRLKRTMRYHEIGMAWLLQCLASIRTINPVYLTAIMITRKGIRYHLLTTVLKLIALLGQIVALILACLCHLKVSVMQSSIIVESVGIALYGAVLMGSYFHHGSLALYSCLLLWGSSIGGIIAASKGYPF